MQLQVSLEPDGVARPIRSMHDERGLCLLEPMVRLAVKHGRPVQNTGET